jgi:putative addiction module component (TIGR02574 family)
MNATDTIFTQALQMSESDRARLAHMLLLSLEPEPPEEEIATAWQDEIERRIEEYERGEVTGVDWREAMDEIRKDLRHRKQS